MTDPRSPRIALVLSGGGSRGAYEVGVLRFLRGPLAERLGRQPRIDVVTGTSVGAINAAFIAATCDQPESQADLLARRWRSLRIENLFSLSTRDLWRAGRALFGNEKISSSNNDFRSGGILKTEGLERFVLQSLQWRRIRQNLERGHLGALAISATQVDTGRTVVFVDGADSIRQSASRDPFTSHIRSAIGPRHCLASAAIPTLFPAVRIGQHFYVDGGLRQNTPMAPAIHLGANRIVVISLSHRSTQSQEKTEGTQATRPTPLFLLGKALNSLLLDHINSDIQRVDHLNRIVDAGIRAFGDNFLQQLGTQLDAQGSAPIRKVDLVHIHPSKDIGQMASQFIDDGGPTLKSLVARRLFQRLGQSGAAHESDLLSYFLFDGSFAQKLMDLGYRDAQANLDKLVDLFDNDDAPSG